MKDRLSEFIEKHGLKHWSFAARKDAEFIRWVDDRTPPEAAGATFPQKVYAATHGEPLICERGNLKGFDSIERGFRFCGRAGKCPCAAESVSKKSRENIDHIARIEASKKGMMRKYGVTNPGQTPKARKAHTQFYADQKKVDGAIAKGQKTMLLRHGVDNALKLSKINRGDVARRNWSELAKEILLDAAKLADFVSNKSINTMTDILGVNATTINNYIRQYDIRTEFGSSFENEIADFLATNGISFRSRVRNLIKGELDFYIEDHHLAIEFNGLYWHSDQIVEDGYHLRKWKACQEAGIRLLMINEDEWLEKKEIIKTKIRILCGEGLKGVGARKLVIKAVTVPAARDFTEQHHLQGAPGNIVAAYGAYHDDTLVACITLGRQRTTAILELSRFCTDGALYSGVFSKILSEIRKHHFETIVTFADLRYSDGNLYRKTGFIQDRIIRPDYRYIKRSKTYHKSLFTKARLSKMGIDMTDKTEKQAMCELGYSRIYDCGKIRYILE